MTVEEIYMRQEIRQMLNEAGINKKELMKLIKEVLNEEVKKACAQAMAESSMEKTLQTYCRDYADRILRQVIKEEICSEIRDKLFGMHLSIKVVDNNNQEIINK